METIKLTLPTMKSTHCMLTVGNAIKDATGAIVKKMAPGQVEVELTTASKSAIVEAIEKAGYKVSNQ